jgi:hypothetical protein
MTQMRRVKAAAEKGYATAAARRQVHAFMVPRTGSLVASDLQ